MATANATTNTKPADGKALVPKAADDAVAQLDSLVSEYGPAALAPLTTMQRSVRLARGIEIARGLIRQLLPQARALMGTQLGFKTDRDHQPDKPYPDAVLAECLTEATLRGVSWVGNEFNIISGRCYITREGYTRLVKELDGLSDLVIIEEPPKGYEGGAVVRSRATWVYDGRPRSHERLIPVRLNAGMGADAALGKARRKMLASIYHLVTGSTQAGSDAADEAPAVDPIASVEELRGRLTGLAAQLGTTPPKLIEYHAAEVGIPAGTPADALTWEQIGKLLRLVEREADRKEAEESRP